MYYTSRQATCLTALWDPGYTLKDLRTRGLRILRRLRIGVLSTHTLEIEVTNISKRGFWILLKDRELFLPFSDFPWFKEAAIEQILDVEWPSRQERVNDGNTNDESWRDEGDSATLIIQANGKYPALGESAFVVPLEHKDAIDRFITKYGAAERQ